MLKKRHIYAGITLAILCSVVGFVGSSIAASRYNVTVGFIDSDEFASQCWKFRRTGAFEDHRTNFVAIATLGYLTTAGMVILAIGGCIAGCEASEKGEDTAA